MISKLLPIEFGFELGLDESVIFYYSDPSNVFLTGATIQGNLQIYNEQTGNIDTFTLQTITNQQYVAIAFTLSNFLRNYATSNYHVNITNIQDSQQIVSYSFNASALDVSGNTLMSFFNTAPNYYIDSTLDKWDNFIVSVDDTQFLLQIPVQVF